MISYHALSDTALIILTQKGDEAAFSEIYQRYSGVLHRHAYSKLNDKEEARDLIQELFVYLWDKRLSLSLTNSLSSYLYSAVRNRVLNIIAHKSVENKYLESLHDFADKNEIIADYQVRERELRDLIEREVAKLPTKMRKIFELSRNEHLSHKEIAQQLQLSEQTVTKQIKNALKILRSKKFGCLVFGILHIIKL